MKFLIEIADEELNTEAIVSEIAREIIKKVKYDSQMDYARKEIIDEIRKKKEEFLLELEQSIKKMDLGKIALYMEDLLGNCWKEQIVRSLQEKLKHDQHFIGEISKEIINLTFRKR